MSSPAWLSQISRPTMTTRRWRYALVVGALIPSIVIILDILSEK